MTLGVNQPFQIRHHEGDLKSICNFLSPARVLKIHQQAGDNPVDYQQKLPIQPFQIQAKLTQATDDFPLRHCIEY